MENTVLGAISNPVRLQMLCCLSKNKMRVGELVGKCGLAQSAVSQHLIKLKQAGLVKDERQGKEIYYSLSDLKTAEIAKKLSEFCTKSQKLDASNDLQI